jgi:hypothetical protein
VNDRQRKVINRMLDDFQGHLTTSKYAKLAKCSNDTALRDIRELLEPSLPLSRSAERVSSAASITSRRAARHGAVGARPCPRGPQARAPGGFSADAQCASVSDGTGSTEEPYAVGNEGGSVMEALGSPALWGSPLGIAMVLVSVGFMLAGLGVLIWGASNDRKAKATEAGVALKEKQFHYERKRDDQA